MSWQALNLAAPEFAVTPDPPKWCGLFYEGKRHLVSGAPESTKTLLALVAAQEALRAGVSVALVDFEMGPTATRLMLTDLGFDIDEIAAVHYFNPEGPPEPDDLGYLIEQQVGLVVIDSALGAFSVSGLDDEKRRDVETWAQWWISPLYAAGVATLTIDHVTKNRENRGRYAIGSERKLGSVDVALGLEDVKPLNRGGTGLIRIRVHKDRPAHLRRPVPFELELHSDPDTHAITYTLREPASSTEGDPDAWRPTTLMERVSVYLEKRGGAVSRNEIEKNVSGKGQYLREAIDFLIADGYAVEEPGPRSSKLVSLVEPFTSSDLVPTSSGRTQRLRPSSPPLRGDEDEVDIAQLGTMRWDELAALEAKPLNGRAAA